MNTTHVVLLNHPENTKLFRLANGLNALIQVEESWLGHCGVCAAKTISNILCNGRRGGAASL